MSLIWNLIACPWYDRKRGATGLTVEDWINCISQLGLDADQISEYTKQPIPGNLYLALAEKQETVRCVPGQLIFCRLTVPNLFFRLQ